MKRILILTLALVAGANAECKSDMSKTCLSKSQVGGFSEMMQGGDPCFLYNGQRSCVVSISGKSKRAKLQSCSCTADCGCKDPETVKSPPKCDNSKVPSNFDIQCGDGYGSDNTMCIYKGIGSKCNNAVCAYGLSEEQKKDILKKHNDLRRRVAKGEEGLGLDGGQPSAADMEELEWDDDLASSAQRWTDQCTRGHDDNRRTPAYKSVGQNAARASSSVNTVQDDIGIHVQWWYDEVKDVSSTVVDSYQPGSSRTEVIGHYTQVVWAKTKKIGCGFIQFNNDHYTRLLNCNYGPAGNMIDGKVYTKGAPGSQCKENNDGLCK